MNKQVKTDIGKTILVAILAILTLFPIIWVVLSSFKPQSELFQIPMSFFPRTWTLENYSESLGRGDFLLYFRNSLVVSVVSTSITDRKSTRLNSSHL